MKIAFIGGGNMAAALIGGLIKRGVAPADLLAIDPNEDARKRNEQQFGVGTEAAADASPVAVPIDRAVSSSASSRRPAIKYMSRK